MVLNELVSLAALIMVFFLILTWGTKEEKDGILLEEELGRKISKKSARISYYLMLVFIFVGVFADNLVNGTINILLLIILVLSMITHPIVEYLYSKEY